MPEPRGEAVRRAALIVNDMHRLRMLLDVPMSDLRDWLAGRADPPIDVFLKAVGLIDAHGTADGRAALRRSQTKGFM